MRRFTIQDYEKVLRIIVGIVSVSVAIVGVYLSFEFFNIESTQHAWLGVFIGTILVVLQYILWHGAAKHPVLVLFGVASLYYGIRANITTLVVVAPNAPIDVLYVAGFAIEILPEFLLLYAIFGNQMPNVFSGVANKFKLGKVKFPVTNPSFIDDAPKVLCRYCKSTRHTSKNCPSVPSYPTNLRG